MTDSIRERIMKNRVTALQGINILNGYQNDIFKSDSGNGSGSAGTLTDMAKSWTVNQWIDAVLTDSIGTKFKVVNNNATTLTVNGSPANGAYTVSMNTVQRSLPEGQKFVTVPSLLVMEGEEIKEKDDVVYVYKKLTVAVGIITNIDTATDSRSADEVLNSLAADVERAWMSDFKCNNLAIGTFYEGAGKLDTEEGQPEIGSFILFSISYRHQLKDPMSL